MRTILGIDAAWTQNEPSGIALVAEQPTGWQCVAVAPSYNEFVAQSEGKTTNWSDNHFRGTAPDVSRLLQAARCLAGTPVDLVTLDMPVARAPFSSRRVADDAISTEFGSRWCSAHSPSSTRPGPLGARLTKDFSANRFPLATKLKMPLLVPSLIEVYPHPALLSLLKRDRRVPYKVSKASRYWPGLDVPGRISAILQEFSTIHAALSLVLTPIPFSLPASKDFRTLSQLKRYEDAIDALVCAWVGIEHLNGRTLALGDETAAIWCPSDVVLSKSPQKGNGPSSRLRSH